MFGWFKERRRRKLIAAPFPEEWEGYLYSNVGHYCVLAPEEQAELKNLVKVFIAEKFWEGCGGLTLTDEIKVTVSAQACLLALGLPHDYYRNVMSVLVYPSAFVVPPREPGIFETVRGPLDPARHLSGQAFQQGPVILVWDQTLHAGRYGGGGHNVVYHEFAHKLDMLDGLADGTPPLKSREEYQEWVRVCEGEYLRLRALSEAGYPTFLDSYGATSEAEFFAVATEEFFDRPVALKHHLPDLYRILSLYYRQDPAERVSRNFCPVEAPPGGWLH